MNADYSSFVNQLKERRPEIADFLLRCERDHLTPEDFNAMGHSVRNIIKLKGNPDAEQICRLAESMQEALNDPTHRINLLSLGRVLLSACNEALTTVNTTPKPSDAFAPPYAFARKPLLLSVDDDRVIRTMVETMFGSYMNVITASDGKHGLRMIREHTPDLVLLDDAMPEMSGMKLIETLREDAATASTTVIMLTSSDRPQDLKRANEAGAADYVIKPFHPKILAEKLYRQLQDFMDK